MTDIPTAFFKWGQLYVGMTDTWRGPWLIGRLRSTVGGTEIVGRAGVDYVNLWGALGLEAVLVFFVVIPMPTVPISWFLLLVPIVSYLLRRQSPYGGRLIDFLTELLDAEDVLARKGDPITR